MRLLVEQIIRLLIIKNVYYRIYYVLFRYNNFSERLTELTTKKLTTSL